MLKIFSEGILKLPNLKAFLEEEHALFADPDKVEAAAGWGHKKTAFKARSFAQGHNLPYIALEDGFIRSFNLGVKGAIPYSISVDNTGCYYDAKNPSLIEKLLADDSWFDAALKEHCCYLIKKIITNNISKYNAAFDMGEHDLPREFFTEKKLLIIDQCAEDASLTLGMTEPDVGMRMLKKAQELYPDHIIYIKSHPDVLAGKRKGLFAPCILKSMADEKEKGVADTKAKGEGKKGEDRTYDKEAKVRIEKEDRAAQEGKVNKEGKGDKIRIIDHDISLISLLKHFKIVFTATSQAGFEALLLGIKVHVFGMPFYAGYGLTEDEKTLTRRKAIKNVTKEKLFAAAYLKLCRYVNPITSKRTSLDDILDLLILQRNINKQNGTGAVVYGVKSWRRDILNFYLGSPRGTVHYVSSIPKAVKLCRKFKIPLVQWASRRDPLMDKQAESLGIKRIYVEDGFLRSKGLGSDYSRPFSLVVDVEGIYYDPESSSSLETILNTIKERKDLKELTLKAVSLINEILTTGLTKYNVGSKDSGELADIRAKLPCDRKIILVPGQVEDDASVKKAGGRIKSNHELLKAVRLDNKDAFIIYKPHPDVLAMNRRGGNMKEAQAQTYDLYDLMVKDVSVAALYDLADEVHVLTSQTGFEALMRNIPVTVYGRPFYAGWGLTHDKEVFDRRWAKLSLQELVAGTLILYPRYFDWCTMLFMRAEDAVYRLNNIDINAMPHDSFIVRLTRRLYAGRRALYTLLKREAL